MTVHEVLEKFAGGTTMHGVPKVINARLVPPRDSFCPLVSSGVPHVLPLPQGGITTYGVPRYMSGFEPPNMPAHTQWASYIVTSFPYSKWCHRWVPKVINAMLVPHCAHCAPSCPLVLLRELSFFTGRGGLASVYGGGDFFGVVKGRQLFFSMRQRGTRIFPRRQGGTIKN